MKRRKMLLISILFLAVIAVILVGVLIVTPVLSQGPIDWQEPLYKQAAKATQQAFYATQRARTTPARGTPIPPAASCPDTRAVIEGIFPFQPGAPARSDLRAYRTLNYAITIGSDGATYKIDAGVSEDNPKNGVIIVFRDAKDLCAELLAGRTASSVGVYITPVGALTITQIQQDTVVLTKQDGSVSNFNFVTGQSDLSFTSSPPATTPIPAPTPRTYP